MSVEANERGSKDRWNRVFAAAPPRRRIVAVLETLRTNADALPSQLVEGCRRLEERSGRDRR